MAQALHQGADRADKLMWKAHELKQMKKNANSGLNGKTSGIVDTKSRGLRSHLDDNAQKEEINGLVSTNTKPGQFDHLDPKAYRYSSFIYLFIYSH